MKEDRVYRSSYKTQCYGQSQASLTLNQDCGYLWWGLERDRNLLGCRDFWGGQVWSTFLVRV